ncbi:MAG: ornithine cyclodeaminase [Coxiella sp. (in: Bacteria)]|nr:MAG: ornithine cyclodeaminase [Coxiella sp. (in: g-proteobacteria)]
MSILFTISDLQKLIADITLPEFFKQAIAALKDDFGRWQEYDMIPRVATHYPHGVIELMPISDDTYYAYKYVNGHPYNPQDNKLTVTAVGMLADVASGYPLLISEMTVLTAIRTAATSALASTYLAKKKSANFGIVGTGSQAEFQAIAHQVALGIEHVFYYDLDPDAMAKFEQNLAGYDLQLTACSSVEEVVAASDLVTTATADKAAARILHDAMIKKGMHINGIGGDCPGKTEVGINLLKRSKIVVEYIDQSIIEGEIQNLTPDDVYAELWQLVCGDKPGRESEDEVTLFDSVGIALEDYSILRLVYKLITERQLGRQVDLIPQLEDPKNLFGLLV